MCGALEQTGALPAAERIDVAFEIRSLSPEVCSFIPITELVPKDWRGWFFEALSANAPFSWGDNNRSLITAAKLLDHAEDAVEDIAVGEGKVCQGDWDDFKTMLEGLGEIYVDLEN